MPVSPKQVLERIKKKNNSKLQEAIKLIDEKLSDLDDYKLIIIFDENNVEGIKMDIKSVYNSVGWNVDFCVNNDNTVTFDFWIE